MLVVADWKVFVEESFFVFLDWRGSCEISKISKSGEEGKIWTLLHARGELPTFFSRQIFGILKFEGC